MKISELVTIRIKELLIEKNITQYRLEQLSGISHGAMSMLLSSKRNSVRLKTIFKIVQAFNITPKEFFNDSFEKLDIDLY